MADIDYEAIADDAEAEAAAYMAAYPVAPRIKNQPKVKKKPKPQVKRRAQAPTIEELMMPTDYAGRIHRG